MISPTLIYNIVCERCGKKFTGLTWYTFCQGCWIERTKKEWERIRLSRIKNQEIKLNKDMSKLKEKKCGRCGELFEAGWNQDDNVERDMCQLCTEDTQAENKTKEDLE